MGQKHVRATRPGAAELRGRAEAKLPERAAVTSEARRGAADAQAPRDAREARDARDAPDASSPVLHELRIHQIELELQNDELRRAQAELEVVRARYFDLYDLAPVGYCTISGRGVILEANLTAADLLGAPRSELQGRPLQAFILREDRDVYYLQSRRLLGAPTRKHAWELRMVRKGGAEFWARLEATADQQPDDPEALRIVILDVTARRRTEEATRASESMLKGITDSVADILYLKDEGGRYRFANGAALAVLGKRLDEVLGHTDRELLADAQSSAVVTEADLRVMRSGVAEIVEERISTAAGDRLFRAQKVPFLGPDGSVVGIVGSAHDITARKLAEATLRASERSLQSSESQMNVAQEIGRTGSWIYDVPNDQIWGSAEGLRIFGYPAVARRWLIEDFEVCIPDRARVHQALAALLAGTAVYDLEYEVEPADGAPSRVVHSLARLERGADGSPLRVVGFLQDVTERRLAEQKLQRLAAELAEANRIKDVFTDVLRHDILNPVGTIKLTIELLLQHEADAAKRGLLERMQRSTRNLVEMTENAAKLATISAGQVASFAETDPRPLLRSVLADFEHKLAEKHLELVDLSRSDAFTARFDPIVKDVFANLLSNAIKYGADGTTIEFAVEDRGTLWELSVRDRGEGVPDEFKKSIFNRFERLDKRGVKGSGLGLAITKQIVDLHGGELWVEDAAPRGSRFVVRLPKHPQPRRVEA